MENEAQLEVNLMGHEKSSKIKWSFSDATTYFSFYSFLFFSGSSCSKNALSGAWDRKSFESFFLEVLKMYKELLMEKFDINLTSTYTFKYYNMDHCYMFKKREKFVFLNKGISCYKLFFHTFC